MYDIIIMEAVIPIVVGGSIYIMSKNSKKNPPHKDNHSRNSKSNSNSSLNFNINNHNVDINVKEGYGNIYNVKKDNRPVSGNLDNNDTVFSGEQNSNLDEYYQFNSSSIRSDNSLDKSRKIMYTSLTGEPQNMANMKHNNMQPFFGATVKQQTLEYNKHEGILDTKIGDGSLLKKKQEIAPLFRPQENISWNYGTPNYNDVMQSRINPSLTHNNTKPFEEIQVGPSSMRTADNTSGTGGFNSGMIGREQWMPKTTNELRTKNNPKETFGGVVLGGKYNVTNRGKLGKVEKYTPDTYYLNTPERYFTTTGVEKAPTNRAEPVIRDTNRKDTTTDHYGAAKSLKNASYSKENIRPSNRPELDPFIKHTSNLSANQRQNEIKSNRISTYEDSLLTNNRITTQYHGERYGIFSSAFKAIVAPMIDAIRPTKKSNAIGSIRDTGNPASTVPLGVVQDPSDIAKPTIKEMTEQRKNHMFVGNQKDAGHTVNKQTPVYQQRDTTNVHYVGTMGNTAGTSNITSYTSAYNANIIDKTDVLTGRDPNGNMALMSGPEQINLNTNKKENVNVNQNYRYTPNMRNSIPSREFQGIQQYKDKSVDMSKIHQIDGDLLSPFKNNPYTKSLSVY